MSEAAAEVCDENVLFRESSVTSMGLSRPVLKRGYPMKRSTKIALLLGAAAILAGSDLAFAQMDGPPPPDGPMQGLMHRDGRLADRLTQDFDLNHDGKITHTEFNTVIAKRFAAAAHGAPGMTLDQFTAIHMTDFQKHAADMFKRIDWKGDGRVTLDEYAAPQRAHFEMMDRDGTGVISCGNGGFERASFAPPPPPDEEGDQGGRGGRRSFGGRGFGGFGKARFCADADLNKDGKVTRAEFDQSVAKRFAAAAHGGSTLAQAAYIADELAHYKDLNEKMFKRLDRDRDGKLNLAEFASGEEKLFARLDRNNDGTIEPDEMKPRFAGRGGEEGGGRSRKPRGA